MGIDNSGGEAWNGTLYFQIYHLENAVAALNVQVSVPADAKTTCTAQWVLPEQDFTGYLVKAYFNEETWVTTGLDCSSDFTVFPRYGYVSDYTADTAQAQAEIQALSDRYHINAYQLYDWMWRHETLIQRSGTEAADSWQDLFGRTISAQTSGFIFPPSIPGTVRPWPTSCPMPHGRATRTKTSTLRRDCSPTRATKAS